MLRDHRIGRDPAARAPAGRPAAPPHGPTRRCQGLGIVRGFFTALDFCAAACLWAESGEDGEAAGAFRFRHGFVFGKRALC